MINFNEYGGILDLDYGQGLSDGYLIFPVFLISNVTETTVLQKSSEARTSDKHMQFFHIYLACHQ